MSASSTSTGSLVRYLLFVSLAAAAVCGSSLIATDTKETDLEANTNETDLKANTNETDLEIKSYEFCGIERVTVPVKVEGCEETVAVVKACNGLCRSEIATTLSAPFNIGSCTSCQPTRYIHSGKKRLKFMCNGKKTLRRVYLPKILECGCVNTTSSIS